MYCIKWHALKFDIIHLYLVQGVATFTSIHNMIAVKQWRTMRDTNITIRFSTIVLLQEICVYLFWKKLKVYVFISLNISIELSSGFIKFIFFLPFKRMRKKEKGKKSKTWLNNIRKLKVREMCLCPNKSLMGRHAFASTQTTLTRIRDPTQCSGSRPFPLSDALYLKLRVVAFCSQ